MKKSIVLISAMLLFCHIKAIAQSQQIIFYRGVATDYHVADFAMWSSDSENYAYSADQWLGIYADAEGSPSWHRVIPDVRSISYGAPWCSLQSYTEKEQTLEIYNQHLACKQILAESKRKGAIPVGTKGMLASFDGVLSFTPLLRNEKLAGKYPEISRTGIRVQLENLLPDQTSLPDKRIMLNEIYARYGYRFKPDGDMDKYFRAQHWYTPNHDNVDVFLTSTEKENAKLLRELLSPETEKLKALYIQQTTAFCRALKENDIDYIKSSTADRLTTGADTPVSWEKFKTLLPEFSKLMLGSDSNCTKDVQEFISYSAFYPQYPDIYSNAHFDYDKQQQKYLLTYFTLDDNCIAENSEINVRGTLINKDYIDITQGEDESVKTSVMVLKTVEMPECINGAAIDQPEWNRYVQLIIRQDDRKKFDDLVGKTVTLNGKVFLAVSAGHFTPVLLENIVLKSVETAK